MGEYEERETRNRVLFRAKQGAKQERWVGKKRLHGHTRNICLQGDRLRYFRISFDAFTTVRWGRARGLICSATTITNKIRTSCDNGFFVTSLGNILTAELPILLPLYLRKNTVRNLAWNIFFVNLSVHSIVRFCFLLLILQSFVIRFTAKLRPSRL